MTTPRLGMTELTENQAGASAVANLAWRRLEAVMCATIVDRDLTAPPGSPTEGAVYIPAATATGAWTGHEGKLLVYLSGWYAHTPKAGFIIYVVDEAKKFIYNGATWDEITAGSGSVPSGTGFTHITAGVQDGAAKLVENADVHASAGIALSKLESIANARLVGNVSGAGATPALVTLDNDATLAANSSTTVPTQQAVKGYVDSVAQGLSPKTSVRVATAAAGTLASSFENGDTVDGVVLATGDRILIKDQASGAENGIYVVAASGAPTRATDFDTAAEIQAGAFVFVEEGTVNADSGWVLTTDGTIVVNTTALAFTQFSGAGQITAGAAMTKTGNTLDVAVDGSTIEVSGDALRVKDAGITYAKIQDVSATDKVLGRSTAGSGDVEEIPCTATGRAVIGAASAAAARAAVGAANTTFSWWYEFGPYNSSGAAAGAVTLSGQASAITDATDPDGHFVGRSAADGNRTEVHFSFPVPDELDLTQPVTATVYYRIHAAGTGADVEIEMTAREVSDDELTVSGGTQFDVANVKSVNSYASADEVIHALGTVFGANTMSAGADVRGVFFRDAQAGNADDTFAGTITFSKVKFSGTRLTT